MRCIEVGMFSGYDLYDHDETGEKLITRMTFGGGIMRIFLLAGDLKRISLLYIQRGTSSLFHVLSQLAQTPNALPPSQATLCFVRGH